MLPSTAKTRWPFHGDPAGARARTSRCSRLKAAASSFSWASQIEDAAGAIRVFADAVSGERAKRPALAELIDHAQPGDSLCVNRLDRLGRSLKELLETVEDIKSRGIHLVSLEKRIDTTSAAGEPVFHVFGAIAHFERRLISERTRDGIEAARKRGRKPGRPPLSGEKVSAAQMLIGAGTAPGQAAKQLNIGRATACRIAKSIP